MHSSTFVSIPSGEYPPVIIQYDHRGKRVSKVFDDYYKARAFYMRMSKEGRNPRVIRSKP
jgi:hypothetical protein